MIRIRIQKENERKGGPYLVYSELMTTPCCMSRFCLQVVAVLDALKAIEHADAKIGTRKDSSVAVHQNV